MDGYSPKKGFRILRNLLLPAALAFGISGGVASAATGDLPTLTEEELTHEKNLNQHL